MRILARLNHRPHRTTNAVGNVTAIEADSLFGDAVNIGCLVDLGTVTTDRLISVVVGKDKQDVWFCFDSIASRACSVWLVRMGAAGEN